MARHRATDRHASGNPGAVWALALANARFWPTVLPETHRELARSRRSAAMITDPVLRELAFAKLADEPFNAEVAATLATLAPRRNRAAAVRAIVTLEVLFDYLDGRTERLTDDPVATGEALSRPLIDPFTLDRPAHPVPDPASTAASQDSAPEAPEPPPDWLYLSGLSQRTRGYLSGLPAAAEVLATAQRAAVRCVQAQTRLHAAATLGDGQLERWARAHAEGSRLDWREYTAGCASSVLALHALIAAAADPATSPSDASRIDSAYLAIGAVITILDSLVDQAQDVAVGEQGFIRLFEPGELTGRLRALTRHAITLASAAPHGDHHVMTLAGVAAYYATHPGARDPGAREAVGAVRGELSPTIWPALAVMSSWRAAKRLRTLRTLRRGAASARSTGIPTGDGE